MTRALGIDLGERRIGVAIADGPGAGARPLTTLRRASDIEVDAAANATGGPRISTAASRTPAWVIPTNEELMIARHTETVLAEAS